MRYQNIQPVFSVRKWTPTTVEVQNYIGALTTPLSINRQKVIDNIVIALHAALGITDLSQAFCFLYLFANEGNEAWKLNLAKRAHDITQHGGVFTENSGWQGNGTDAYLDTNFNGSIDGGTVYTLNNASLGVYSLTNSLDTTCDIGARTGTNDYTAIIPMVSGGAQCSIRMHNGIVIVVVGPANTSIGMFSVERNAPTQSGLSAYQNKNELTKGVSVGNTTNIPNCKIFIGARSYSNTPELFSSRKYAFAWAGKYFTPAQLSDIYDILVQQWL